MTIAHDHYGYDQDYEEPFPTLLLDCPTCHGDVSFYGDVDGESDTFTLPSDTLAVCTCGAIYGEGDTLEVVQEQRFYINEDAAQAYLEAKQQRNPVTLAYHEAQRDLAATHGWPALTDTIDPASLIDAHDAAHVIAELRGQMAAAHEALGQSIAAMEEGQALGHRLATRLSDKGLYGDAADMNGFYNGTGVDGENVQAFQGLIAAIAAARKAMQ